MPRRTQVESGDGDREYKINDPAIKTSEVVIVTRAPGRWSIRPGDVAIAAAQCDGIALFPKTNTYVSEADQFEFYVRKLRPGERVTITGG